MRAKMVKMTKDGKTATVVESSFHKVWKERGWSLKQETQTQSRPPRPGSE